MKIEQSIQCIVDDHNQVHLEDNQFNIIFNRSSRYQLELGWTIVPNIPKALQAYVTSGYVGCNLLILTVDHQLLLINQTHPTGITLPIDSIKHIYFYTWVHEGIKCPILFMVVITDDNRMYRYVVYNLLERALGIPQWLGDDVMAVSVINRGGYLTWLDVNGVISVCDGDGTIITLTHPRPIKLLIEDFIIDEDDALITIDRVELDNDMIMTTALCKLDYVLKDVTSIYPINSSCKNEFSIIDEDRILRFYCTHSNKLIRIDDRKAIRFIHFSDMSSGIEMEDDDVTIDGYKTIGDIRPINIDDYKERIKSANG